MTPFAKTNAELELDVELEDRLCDVDVLVTKDDQTMAEMKTAH